jgi:hypothetical protein
MRTLPILLLAVGLMPAACADADGPLSGDPATDGTLIVSTASGGNDADRNGYLLTVDGAQSLFLQPTDTAAIELPAGRYTLRLSGMAEHCSVTPGTALDVEVLSGDTTSVALTVECSLTGARITATTTGLDFDTDGYRYAVDGIDRGILPPGLLPSVGTVLTLLDPGSHTIALTGLSPNCTIAGIDSHTVTIVDTEIRPVEFEVVCTAASGVIGVVLETSGTAASGGYRVMVDGGNAFAVLPSTPRYFAPTGPGEHVVSLLAPGNCSVEANPRSVRVTTGSLIRDTAFVRFWVTCTQGFGRIRITVPTTGSVPPGYRYDVVVCTNRGFLCPWEPILRRELAPNDTLIARYGIIEVSVELKNIPANCRVQTANPTPFFTILADSIRDVRFPVVCGR